MRKALLISLFASAVLANSSIIDDFVNGKFNPTAPLNKTEKKANAKGIVFAPQSTTRELTFNNKTLKVDLSFNQINRVVLPNAIVKHLTNAEKNLEIITNGNEAFISFKPKVTIETFSNNQTRTHKSFEINKSVEAYLFTRDLTYSFVFNAKAIDAQTIFVKSNEVSAEILKDEKNLPLVEVISKITAELFSSGELRGYKKQNLGGILVADNSNFRVTATQKFSGSRFEVFYLNIKSKSNEPLEFSEKDLIALTNKAVFATSVYYANDIYKILPFGSAKAMIIAKKD